jgi:hypothetical protein
MRAATADGRSRRGLPDACTAGDYAGTVPQVDMPMVIRPLSVGDDIRIALAPLPRRDRPTRPGQATPRLRHARFRDV